MEELALDHPFQVLAKFWLENLNGRARILHYFRHDYAMLRTIFTSAPVRVGVLHEEYLPEDWRRIFRYWEMHKNLPIEPMPPMSPTPSCSSMDSEAQWF